MKPPLFDSNGRALVGVYIGCENPQPVTNYLAYYLSMQLLARVLWRTLESNGIADPVDNSVFAGTVFDGYVTVRSFNHIEAIALVKAELEHLHLLKNCKIGFVVDNGTPQIEWESVFPGPDINLGYCFDPERQEMVLAKQIDSLNRFKK